MRTAIIMRGNELLQHRIRAGLSKSDLATLVGISHSAIVRAEQGGRVSPKTAVALSNALKMSFDDLFIIDTDTGNAKATPIRTTA